MSVLDQNGRIQALGLLARWRLTSHALYYKISYSGLKNVNVLFFGSPSTYFFLASNTQKNQRFFLHISALDSKKLANQKSKALY
jgi:hypothetical protein